LLRVVEAVYRRSNDEEENQEEYQPGPSDKEEPEFEPKEEEKPIHQFNWLDLEASEEEPEFKPEPREPTKEVEEEKDLDIEEESDLEGFDLFGEENPEEQPKKKRKF